MIINNDDDDGYNKGILAGDVSLACSLICLKCVRKETLHQH